MGARYVDWGQRHIWILVMSWSENGVPIHRTILLIISLTKYYFILVSWSFLFPEAGIMDTRLNFQIY